MEKKSKCEDCVWRAQTGPGVILCAFPKCVKEKYKRYWPGAEQKGHGKKKDG